ncbi:hypothetical protein BA895_12540 [Humibacillus sp. DSM 29435]|uniref:hypothetical protein n=1 Tax=Humibacillus sp. DSM 29435 TaxID=1869167 RepID=UPI000871FCAC|nr:hypothetical protein [Humibacillus sp. DSM 29435]OFE18438.1 hypothetical protein BA895_12540 [Humibacillus sp. DSM 29435]
MTRQALLVSVLVLATSVWVGGYVAIVVVARTATATLEPAARVRFFRSLGRRYLWVGGPALLVALATGAVLLRSHEWDLLLIATAAAAVALLLLLALAVGQARRMTRLRRRSVDDPANTRLTRQVTGAARGAAALRGVLGLFTVALVVLGACLATG